ncbi:MAG TPA: VTT domain-containing protein [Usitatibacter sp.]|nr:VTT domain-containing protein [Usitatibacter sp.]
MFDWGAETGLWALFASAFISATVLPASSELVLAAVVRAAPGNAATAIAVATLGNTLGGLTTYVLGRLLPARTLPAAKVVAAVRRYGAWLLLLSWVPIVGDGLCAAAGWLRVPVWAAAVAMAAGKLARYVAVAHAASLF